MRLLCSIRSEKLETGSGLPLTFYRFALDKVNATQVPSKQAPNLVTKSLSLALFSVILLPLFVRRSLIMVKGKVRLLFIMKE